MKAKDTYNVPGLLVQDTRAIYNGQYAQMGIAHLCLPESAVAAVSLMYMPFYIEAIVILCLSVVKIADIFSVVPLAGVLSEMLAIPLLEIFPRLYLVQAKQNPKEWSKLTVQNSVLTNYDSAPLPNGLESEDEVDAIISSAALRRFACNEACWKPDKMSDYARDYEGWIFGV